MTQDRKTCQLLQPATTVFLALAIVVAAFIVRPPGRGDEPAAAPPASTTLGPCTWDATLVFGASYLTARQQTNSDAWRFSQFEDDARRIVEVIGQLVRSGTEMLIPGASVDVPKKAGCEGPRGWQWYDYVIVVTAHEDKRLAMKARLTNGIHVSMETAYSSDGKVWRLDMGAWHL